MNTTQDAHFDHISQQFNVELDDIRTQLMSMGSMIEQQLNDAMQSLKKGDSSFAYAAIKMDEDINKLEMSINDQCTRIIARRQPAASDLRFIIAISKAITDLERTGDEVKRVASNIVKLVEEGATEISASEIRNIAKLVSGMISDSLTAFARYDVELAYEVVKRDEEVDEEYKTAIRALVTRMMEEPRSIATSMNVIWILRSLERVGDHAENIAQHLVYLVKGIDVSHATAEEMQATIEQ